MQSSIEELKVAAYDTLSEIERLQKQLQILNGMIAQKLKEPVVPEVTNATETVGGAK